MALYNFLLINNYLYQLANRRATNRPLPSLDDTVPGMVSGHEETSTCHPHVLFR
jgi:hypothetical protein